MVTVTNNLRYLSAGIEQLDRYLFSKEIYWPIGIQPLPGEPDFPRLTLGGILLARTRVESFSLAQEQQIMVDQLDIRLNEVRSKWRVAWDQKISIEFRSRLRIWRDYLDDYRQNPGGNVDRYPYEVQRRAMLELLGGETAKIDPTERELRSALDQLLRAKFIPGGFVWDEDLAAGFPAEKYWFLYGNLRVA